MKKSSITLRTGARGSNLSRLQSKFTKDKIESLFPFINIEFQYLATPGDRDKKTSLQNTADNFFTKNLDDGVINGNLDIAVHSAKDIPYPIHDGLDWFWLPWNEDRRDVTVISSKNALLKNNPVIGVSSDRRETYALKRWPNATMKPIRGNIEERIKQLDDNKYDIIITAAAALNRLNLTNRIAEYIPLKKLITPEAQGSLAITYRSNNTFLNTLKQYFFNEVIIAGAGPGSYKLASLATIEALKNCDICLHDALIDPKLLDFVSTKAECIYVGKREYKDSTTQEYINNALIDYARQGKKVVRLKGGDPGIFARITEETKLLEKHHIPFRVIPGISSMSAATSTTGLILTTRGLSRGFKVATLRIKKSKYAMQLSDEEQHNFPFVFFMCVSQIEVLIKYLLNNNYSKSKPLSIVFEAGTDRQNILLSTIGNIVNDLKNHDSTQAGLIIVGDRADKINLFKHFGVFKQQKILLTCSETIINKAANYVHNFGGQPIRRPLITHSALETDNLKTQIKNTDWLIITSPTSIKVFMKFISNSSYDVRKLPKIFVCGKGSVEYFKTYNIVPDAVAENNFGSKGIIQNYEKFITKSDKVLRLRSDIASDEITKQLRKDGMNITDVTLYKNEYITYNDKPVFDSVVFASSSAVKSFIYNWGINSLKQKTVVVIGTKTKSTILDNKIDCKLIISPVATLRNCIEFLALETIKTDLINIISTN
ncbi:MAG: uroporphyrinogen-III C-methyltransferase [bacterium]|nr:uroporphyrinogen-III C-methyltransferase [bacterium]